MSEADLKATLQILQRGQDEMLERLVAMDKTLRGANGQDGIVSRVAVLEDQVRTMRTQARFLWGAIVTLGAPVVQMVFSALSK